MFSIAAGQEGAFSSGRMDPTASRPTQPRPTQPPRRAPPRPDRSVVFFRVLDSTGDEAVEDFVEGEEELDESEEYLDEGEKILLYIQKNTAGNLTFNVELVNGDFEAVLDKPVEVQKEVREPAGRKAAGRRTETPVTRRQMPRVGVRRRQEQAR